MVDKTISQIQFEIEQIDHLFETYSDLFEEAQKTTPNLVEVTAVASVLHSFYNGVENIFLSVAKGIDSDVPSGAQWHRNLLTQMVETTPNRNPVLTQKLAERLADYLGFRHFYRHSYSFFLDWNELERLAIELPQIWDETKNEILIFLNNLKPENK